MEIKKNAKNQPHTTFSGESSQSCYAISLERRSNNLSYLGGDHPTIELLGLRLGLEALANPLTFPPLRADIDQIALRGGLDAHCPSLYRKEITILLNPHRDTVPNLCLLTLITFHRNTVLLYSIQLILAVFN